MELQSRAFFLSQLGRLSTSKSQTTESKRCRASRRLFRGAQKKGILSQPSVRPSSGRKEASGGPELVLNHYQLHDKTHTHTHNAALLEPVRRKQETCSTGEGEGCWGGGGGSLPRRTTGDCGTHGRYGGWVGVGGKCGGLNPQRVRLSPGVRTPTASRAANYGLLFFLFVFFLGFS